MARIIEKTFYGWRVVGATFVLAAFGWGIGFYGPPIYLQAIRDARAFPLWLVSSAVTAHFLVGVVVIANLPALYRRFGLPQVTKAGALLLALGIVGWAAAREPWQLIGATVLSGAGWVAMGAAAVNAIIAPWFVRRRPAALAMAYNGASVGGIVFAPLWVAAIGWLGFETAAGVLGLVMIVVVWCLADWFFSKSPASLGLAADGDERTASPGASTAIDGPGEPTGPLWLNRRFLTLSAAMALGLFAQIGLLAHLFSLLVPVMGGSAAGFAMAGATAAAIAGRTLVGWLMPASVDRRLVASASYGVQIAGSLVLLAAAGSSVPMLLAGVVLFGAGIGNATSLPPLIAQREFAKADQGRVVALIVAIAQASYAFAPVLFGLLRSAPVEAWGVPGDVARPVFILAALVQALAIAALLAGRRRSSVARVPGVAGAA